MITITEKAKENLTKAMGTSGFEVPALRIVFAGFG